MLAEVGVALVEEEHGVGGAVETWEIPLLVLGRVVRVLTVRTPIAAAAGGRLRLLLQQGHIGLHGSHVFGDGLDGRHEIGCGGLCHDWREGDGRGRGGRWGCGGIGVGGCGR